MPFNLTLPTIRNPRGAGRRKHESYVNLDNYTDPSTPPHHTGWIWCESMNVWLPDDLPVTSGILFNNVPACASCPNTSTRARPPLLHRLSSKAYWRARLQGSKHLKNKPITTGFCSVRASGVTFSQIRLREIYPEQPCCDRDASTNHSYLF
ncbi:hypothetical protein BC628DRAFT_1499015 [Trametes gibbosa]|nr:hypothetical protein BC628DRAFT_1499015 [Trametes gibbosa]